MIKSKAKLLHVLIAFVVLVTFSAVFFQVRATALGPAQSEITFDSTPGQNSFFSIQDPDIYEAQYGCRVAPAGGFIGNLLDTAQYMFSLSTFSEGACAIDKGEEELLVRSQRGGLNSSVYATNVILLDQRPASGTQYIDQQVYALQNFGDVSAQEFYYPGTGFSLLSPMQSFWGWSVNVVYGFLIILIIVVAFGIMFRARLGGSAAITLQSAIPSIALAMVLVPLSYAITGLFIDAITLGTNVVHEFVMGPGAPGRQVFEDNPGTRGYFADDERLTWLQAWQSVDVSVEAETLIFSEGLSNDALLLSINNFIDQFPGDPFGDRADERYVQTWIGDIINFIIQILLFLTGLRIFLFLIRKYIVMFVAPILAPFVFATVALPGTGAKNVMMFMKTLMAASLFYIVTYSLFLLTIVFTSTSFHSQVPDFQTSGYVPPLLGLEGVLSEGQVALNANSGGLTGFIFTLIALFIFLGIPRTLKTLDEQLGTDKSIITPMIQNSLESARYSIGVGNVLRQAPGRIVDSFDKFRGRTPGEQGSVRGAIRNRVGSFNARLDRSAQSGNVVASGVRNVVGRGLSALSGNDFQGGASKNAGGDKGEKSLKATVMYAGSEVGGGYFKFTRSMALGISRKMEQTGAPEEIPGFNIELEATGMILPNVLSNRTVTIINVDSGGSIDPNSGRIAGAQSSAKVGKGARKRKANDVFGSDIFGLTTGVEVSVAKYTLAENNTKAGIKISLVITNPNALFGYVASTRTTAGYLNEGLGAITSWGSLRSKELKFRINGVESNPISFNLQMTDGGN